MKTIALALAGIVLAGTAHAQASFDPIKPFFGPAAKFNSAVQTTIGDAGTIKPTANAIGAPSSIFTIGSGLAAETSVLLGPIK